MENTMLNNLSTTNSDKTKTKMVQLKIVSEEPVSNISMKSKVNPFLNLLLVVKLFQQIALVTLVVLKHVNSEQKLIW